jgi:radical SAM superfamily enzyme YgiQ (UPF0313 family)
MRVCLVGDRDDPADTSVSLGHLCLVPVIEACGGTVDLIELSTIQGGHRASHAAIADHILQHAPDLIGFTGMCDTYHRILRVASECKRARPGTTIILGGPQPSATDVATMEAFPEIDLIVRGEGEATLREVLDGLRSGRDPSGIDGLTLRRNGRVARNRDRELIRNLDTLPFPAFDRQRYDAGVANVEAGRGCPFSCVYCSTSVHWQRRYRLKSPLRLVDEITHLNTTHGVTTFCLVHDLFTVNRQAVMEFCRLLSTRGLKVEWGCSARTDLLDEALLDHMAASGCVSIYFGIEAGSARTQHAIGKGLDLAEAQRIIRAASRHRLRSTASFIVGFPQESAEDVAATLGFCASLLPQSLVRIELHHLMYLAGTPLYDAYASALRLPGNASVASSGSRFSDPDSDGELIRQHPDLFPSFYQLPEPAHGMQASLVDVETFGRVAFNEFRLSSDVVIRQSNGDVLGYYFRWRQAMLDDGVLEQPDGPAVRPAAPGRTLLEATHLFLADRESADRQPQLRELIRYEMIRSSVEWVPHLPEGKNLSRCTCLNIRPGSAERLSQDDLLSLTLVTNPSSRVECFDYDMAELLRCVKQGGNLAEIARRPCPVLFWAPSFATTMSRTLTTQAARLLEACSTPHTGRSVVASLLQGGADAAAATEHVWVELLRLFCRKGILVAAATA